MFGDAALAPGKMVQAVLPLPPEYAKAMTEEYGQTSTTMKVGIAVPDRFDPKKPQRVLITSASSTGDGLSIKNMSMYTTAALARGWVVMSAEGEFGKGKKSDGIGFRENLLEVMLQEVSARWPDAKNKWSFATGGFSGGAGYASHQAVVMLGQEWRMIGMLLMNSTYNPTSWEREKSVKGSRARWHKIPIFVSAGETDNVQKPESIKVSLEMLKKGGYHTERSEWHPGGHQAKAEHIPMALEWFESLEKAPAT